MPIEEDPPRPWTPHVSMQRLSELVGEEEVAAWCAGLLNGDVDEHDPERPSLTWLGGDPAGVRLARTPGEEGGWKDYWVRTWAARGLLYAFAPEVIPAVSAALEDQHWRVREMAAKVCARHGIAEPAERLAGLLADENARVRAAAARALGSVAESEQLPALAAARDDPERTVAAAADRALAAALARLDLPGPPGSRE